MYTLYKKVKLPLTFDLVHTVQKKPFDYKGIYTSVQTKRIAKFVVGIIDSDIEYSISFTIDSQRFTVLTVNAKVKVTLECQRCGKPFTQYIHTRYCCIPVHSDKQAKELPEAYEPIEVNEFGEIDLLSLIEDEIILTLPMIPVHDSEYCKTSASGMIFGKLLDKAQKPNLFAMLASLKP